MSDVAPGGLTANRQGEMRGVVSAAVAHERQTGGLRQHLTVTLGATGVPNPAYIEGLATLVQTYIEWVPTALDALRAVVDDPANGPVARSVLTAGQDSFLGSGPVVQPGLIGLLDNAYVVVQLFVLAYPTTLDPNLVQSHTTVRSLLGPQLVTFLDQLAGSLLNADSSSVGSASPAPAAAVPTAAVPTNVTEPPPAPAPRPRKERTGTEKPGDLDVTFGGEGRVTVPIGQACTGVLQPDGAIVAAGSSSNAGVASGDFSIARFLDDGSLDPSFGNAGTMIVQFGSGIAAEAHAVVIQNDGKLIACGYLAGAFCLARLNADGSLDASFGTAGRVVTPFPGRDTAQGWAAAVQADGRILVVGDTGLSDQDIGLARYNPDGSLDTSFGSSMTGLVTTDVSGGFDSGRAILLLPSGHILVAGRTASAGAALGDFFLARYTSNGLLDTAFGSAGKVVTDFSVDSRFTDDCAYDIAVQSDGRIVVVGSTGDYSYDAALARFEADGMPDTTFGLDGTGRVVSDFGTGYEKVGYATQFDAVNAVVVLDDGRIVIGGSTHSVAGEQSVDFLIACYDSTGNLDPSFGPVRTDFGGTNDVVESLVVTQAGDIVAIGSTGDVNRPRFALARYIGPSDVIAQPVAQPVVPESLAEVADESLAENVDVPPKPNLDLSFGTEGILFATFVGSPAEAQALCLDPDGRIVLVGTAGNPDQPRDIAIARCNRDGLFDETFGAQGAKRIDISGTDDVGHAVALDPAGRIVVAGEVLDEAAGVLEFTVLRLNPDGSVDTTFNDTGEAQAEFSGGTDGSVQALAVQDDGKIVAVGYVTASDDGQPPTNEFPPGTALRTEYFAVARFDDTGRLDATFGEGGAVVTPFVGDLARANAVAIDSAGRIVAAGFARRAPADHACDIAVVRYEASGELDETFGDRGIAILTHDETDDMAHAVALQPDQKIVLVGTMVDKELGTCNPFVARLDPAGILDPDFGGVGLVSPDIDGAARCAAVLSDGTIVTAGYAIVFEDGDDGQSVERQRFAVMAHRADGEVVDDFGVNGLHQVELGGVTDEVASIAVQPDGKIVLCGTSRTSESTDPVLVRLDAISNPA